MQRICLFLMYLVFIHCVLAKQRRFEFNVQKTELNPDCFNQSYSSLTVNGQYPGPILRVVKNDIVEVLVKNNGDNNVSTSIHFHGIYQLGTNFADGVAGITQVPILPGQEFLHQFKIKGQTGTFYYHAHVGVQDDTVQGPLIIYESEESLWNAVHGSRDNKMVQEGPYKYHEERILHWAEWWHQSIYERERSYLAPNFSVDPGPDSVLLNGRSVYDKAATDDCPGFTVIDVKPNRVYRLRFIGALTYRMLGITIPHHNLTLIELDAEYVKPYPIDHLELVPGQRSSVLIHTGNYTDGTMFPILSHFKWKAVGAGEYTPNGFGYIRYVDSDSRASSIKVTQKPTYLPETIKPEMNGWVLPKLRPAVPGPANVLSVSPSRTIKLAMHQIVLPDNTTRFINNGRIHQAWESNSMSLLDQIRNDPDHGELSPVDGFSVKHQTYPIKLGEIVDVVFQNMKTLSGLCNAHPYHTHGHAHYLLAQGEGDYDHEQHKNVVTYPEPLLKDVSMQYPAPINGSIPCGWTKIRIHATNPGVWAVHCHITEHMLQGKIVVFEVSPSKSHVPKN